jgi:hypothetical protein
MASNFVPIPNRDASATIRGFCYQIELTIRRWLELAPDDVLELECGEDIDIVQRAFAQIGISNDPPERLLEQVKLRSSSVSLRSPEILQALFNFYCHIKNNPTVPLRFRYLSNSQAALERDRAKGQTEPGLHIWNAIAKDETGNTKAQLGRIRLLLENAPIPAQIKKSDWDGFRAFWGDDSQLWDFIRRVEWSLANPDLPSISEEIEKLLVSTGQVAALDAQKAHERLFLVVLRKISSSGIKHLLRNDLLDQIRTLDATSVNSTLLGIIRAQLVPDNQLTELSNDLKQLVLRIREHVADGVLPAKVDATLANVSLATPPAVLHGTKRSANVNMLAQRLAQVAWLSLRGESGSGKTQLAVLLAERMPRAVWVDLRSAPQAQSQAVFETSLMWA